MQRTAATPAPHRLSLAEQVDALRESLDLTVADLAELVSTDRTHLWRVLNAKRSANRQLLARCLVALADVMEGTPCPTP